jgi:hypothetical protein
LFQYGICDLAALPGLLLFLCNGDILLLAGFAVLSSLFYLRTLPSARLLGEALLQPGPAR